jgi:hypothetical protein
MTDSHQMFCTLMQAFVLYLPRSAWGDIRRLVTLAWAAHFYHGVHLLGVAFGSCHLALAQLDEPNQDPWLLVSDDFTDLTTLEEYGLRLDLEENFLDDKSNSFQVEASRLAPLPTLNRPWPHAAQQPDLNLSG